MECTIGNIYDFYNEYPEYIGDIEVCTQYGYKTIEYCDITAYNSDVYQLTLENGMSIKCSPKHRVKDINSNWWEVSNIHEGLDILVDGGSSKVKTNTLLNYKDDLYDIQVKDVHEYYSNGIVSHNSAVLNSLSFNLFGVPLKKVNLAGLINSVNKKGLLTECVFTTKGNRYKIVRGEKPKVFDLYINDELQDKKAKASDTQAQIEKILGMDHKLFVQMIVLNKERFRPFMDLTAAERRKIVEDILNINVFSHMTTITNNDYRVVENKVTDLTYTKDKLEGQKEAILKIIEEEKNKGEAEFERIQKEIDLKLSDAAMVQALIEEKTKEVSRIEAPEDSCINKLSKQITEACKILNVFESKVSGFKKEIHFYSDNDVCPTCKSTLDEDFKEVRINTLQSEQGEIEKQIELLNSTIQSLEEKKTALTDTHNTLKTAKSTLETEIAVAKQSFKSVVSLLEALKKQQIAAKSSGIDHHSKIVDIDKQIEDINNELEEILNEQKTLAQIKILLKDDGIKASIIDSHLEFINVKLNEYLQLMGFYININIDKNFNATVHSINKDGMTYDNLSSGQKLRVNLSLWLALLEMSAMKNSVATNIVILDEILEPLDVDGVQNVLALFKDRMMNKNLFVITQHPKEFRDYFHSEIEFEQKNGFTEIV